MPMTRLKYAMLSYEGSQQDLCRATGIHQTFISQYVTGKKQMWPRHLLLISEALQVDAIELLGEVDEDEMDVLP
jgi:transcriptional regulator with XRE-family HTH domain